MSERLLSKFECTPQFVSERTQYCVQLAPSGIQRAKLGIDRIEIARRGDGPTIEVTHRLAVTPLTIRDGWHDGRRTAQILEAKVELIPFEPQLLRRVEGVPLADTRALAKRFGTDWPDVIAADPALLNQTKFSAAKRSALAQACKRDFDADKKIKRGRALIAQFCAAGIPKAKARSFAKQYERDKGPYQFCLAGKMGFLHSDRFANIVYPGKHADRALAIVMASFADCDDTIRSRDEIADQTWLNHGLDENETRLAIDALAQRGYLKEHDSYFGPAAVFEAEEFLAEFVKAQGSQFRAVIAPLAKTYKNVGIVQRSAIYTQLSRAREKLVLIGDAKWLFGAAEIGEKPRRTLLLLASARRAIRAPSRSAS
jgi:hypothetical protein